MSAMATLCENSGDKGFEDCRPCCSKCQIPLNHRYCMAKKPKDLDKGFRFVCAQCVSAHQIPKWFPQYVLRRHRQPPRIRREVWGSRFYMHVLNETLANDGSPIAETEVGLQVRKTLPTLQTPPSEEDAPKAEVQRSVVFDLNKSSPDKEQPQTCNASLHFRTSVSKKHVVPQADGRSGSRKDLPAVLDLEKRPAEVKPLINEVIAETHLNVNNKRDHTALVQDMEIKLLPTLQTRPSEKDAPKAEVQRSVVSHLQTSVPEFDLNKSSPDKKEQPQMCTESLHFRTSVSKSLVKHVLPQADNRSGSRNDLPAVQDLEKRPAEVDPLINEVIAETYLNVNNKRDHTAVVQDMENKYCQGEAKILLQKANLNENDKKQPRRRTRRRLIVNHDWDENDEGPKDLEVQESQVAPAKVDFVVPKPQVILPGVFPASIAEPLKYPSQDPCVQVPYPYPVYAQPILDPLWGGCFQIGCGRYEKLVSHMSNKACFKVFEAAKVMPQVLSVKMMPRTEAWPKSFYDRPPRDDNIGLYFFPGSESVVKAYDKLMNHIVKNDLALLVSLGKVELLMFSSNQLPQSYWRFNGKYYIWGTFRERKLTLSYKSGPLLCAGNKTLHARFT